MLRGADALANGRGGDFDLRDLEFLGEGGAEVRDVMAESVEEFDGVVEAEAERVFHGVGQVVGVLDGRGGTKVSRC